MSTVSLRFQDIGGHALGLGRELVTQYAEYV